MKGAVSKDNSVEHSSKTVCHIRVIDLFNLLVEMLYRVEFTNWANDELLGSLLGFFLNPFLVVSSQLFKALELYQILFMLLLKVSHFEVVRPVGFFQVSQHFLLEFILSVIDHDRIVVLVQTSFASHNWVLLDVSNVRGSLSGFDLAARHDDFFLDVTEAVDHDLSFHRLNGVNNHTYLSLAKLLHWSLGFHISTREPRAEARMWMVPSNNIFSLSNLFKHIHVLLLEDRVNRLDWDSSSSLRHGEDIFRWWSNHLVLLRSWGPSLRRGLLL